MAARRTTVQDTIEAPTFTLDAIVRGINRLRKRIDDVKSLQTDKVLYDDQRVTNVEKSIINAILETYGPRSPQYKENQYLEIWHGPKIIGMQRPNVQRSFENGIPQTITLIEGLIADLEERKAEFPSEPVSSAPEQRAPATADSRKVFVIHGRDEKTRKAMFDFLRALGLSPLEWNHAVSLTQKAAPYVGEVLDAAFNHAQAVIALLTGDDEARLRPELAGVEEPLTPQARPNVLFEAGMALGRQPTRTIFVEVGTLRPFSDIAGVHTIRFDNSLKKRQDLAERLRVSRCAVETSGTDWHDAGNFA